MPATPRCNGLAAATYRGCRACAGPYACPATLAAAVGGAGCIRVGMVRLVHVVGVRIADMSFMNLAANGGIVVVASCSHGPHTTSNRVCIVDTLVIADMIVVGAAVTTAIDDVGLRTVEEVVVAGIPCVDGERPEVAVAIHHRAVEVGTVPESAVLVRSEDVAQVGAEVIPVDAVYGGRSDAEEVVEIHLIDRLVLHLRKIEFVGHLVCDESGLIMCHLVAHAFGG